MTNEELLDIVKMRLDGCTFADIGKKYGITRQAVEQSIKSICGVKRSGRRKVVTHIYMDIIYPNIRDKMIELEFGYSSLADKTGSSAGTIRRVLIGYIRKPNLYLAKKIAFALNMSVDEAFSEEESVREYEERTLTDWMDEGYSENDDEIWGDESDEYD